MGPKDFTHLYTAHAQSVYAYLCYRTGDRVLAEDLLADTFERALRARRGYDRRRASERTWLYAIALNCVRDNSRRIAAESRALAHVGASESGSVSIGAGTDEVELKAMLDQALSMLSDEEREVLSLRFGADLALAEIAAVLAEPRSKVETRIYRGLRKLRSILGAEF